jgi:hypothetical protein
MSEVKEKRPYVKSPTVAESGNWELTVYEGKPVVRSKTVFKLQFGAGKFAAIMAGAEDISKLFTESAGAVASAEKAELLRRIAELEAKGA